MAGHIARSAVLVKVHAPRIFSSIYYLIQNCKLSLEQGTELPQLLKSVQINSKSFCYLYKISNYFLTH